MLKSKIPRLVKPSTKIVARDETIHLKPSSDDEFVPEHPLSINTVFREISKRLGFTELKNCRLVCKKWLLMVDEILNDEGTDLIVTLPTTLPEVLNNLPTSKVERCAVKNGGLQPFWAGFPVQNQDQTVNILRMLSSHNKFRHMSVLAIQDSRLPREQFQQLIRTFAKTVETLKLNNYVVISRNGYGTKDSTILPIEKGIVTQQKNKKNVLRKFLTFPRVRSLELTTGVEKPGTAKAIFETFPGLAELKMHGDFSGFLASTSSKLASGEARYQNLRKLSIRHSWNYTTKACNVFTCLSKMNLKLKFLEASFNVTIFRDTQTCTTTNLCFQQFLTSLKDTLEVLKLEMFQLHPAMQQPTPNVWFQIFPSCGMQKLRSLTLAKSFVSGCLRGTLLLAPNTRDLTILFYQQENWNMLKLSGNGVGKNVKRLTVSKMGSFLETHGPELFPNLVELYLNKCTTDQLRFLFKTNYFQRLSVLSLQTENDAGITDSGLLGLPPNLLETLDEQNNIPVAELAFPHIGLMKELKKLIITRELALPVIQSTLFTMKSLRFGIFKLPKLNEVILNGQDVLSVATQAAVHCEQFGLTFSVEDSRMHEFPSTPAQDMSRTFKFSKESSHSQTVGELNEG